MARRGAIRTWLARFWIFFVGDHYYFFLGGSGPGKMKPIRPWPLVEFGYSMSAFKPRDTPSVDSGGCGAACCVFEVEFLSFTGAPFFFFFSLILRISFGVCMCAHLDQCHFLAG